MTPIMTRIMTPIMTRIMTPIMTGALGLDEGLRSARDKPFPLNQPLHPKCQ